MKPSESATPMGAQADCLAVGSDPLLCIERHLGAEHRAQLAADVRAGLGAGQKSLPPKYFYDARGSQLFDAICDLPEYYLTRTEFALLQTSAADLIAQAGADQLVELGSGASRKTRLLLDALVRHQADACYVPIDVSESALRSSAEALRAAYPDLRVHGMVADYERAVPPFPSARRRLVVFLGSTIGNFTPPADVAFLRGLAGRLAPGERLLLGVDLVKSSAALHAAYNDSAGVTAEFNRNVLRVLNRELEADFDPERFDHVALFNAEAARIEMYLRARTAHRVRIGGLDLDVAFAAGETIHTENSHKYTRASVDALLGAAGFQLDRWTVSPDGAFAFALATVEARA